MKRKIKPFITVSREAGSGGKLVAKKLAKALGFGFYDDELIDLTAKKANLRRRVVARLDERERTFVSDLMHKLLNPEYVHSQTYIKSLCEVVEALSIGGGVVILGRGGNFITSQDSGLHIRVVAPFWTRVNYTVCYEKRSMRDAKKRVKEYDRERKEFIKQYFDKNPSNPEYYDLVLNTENLTIDEAVAAGLIAFSKKFG
jgi:cytidylate kinase